MMASTSAASLVVLAILQRAQRFLKRRALAEKREDTSAFWGPSGMLDATGGDAHPLLSRYTSAYGPQQSPPALIGNTNPTNV